MGAERCVGNSAATKLDRGVLRSKTFRLKPSTSIASIISTACGLSALGISPWKPHKLTKIVSSSSFLPLSHYQTKLKPQETLEFGAHATTAVLFPLWKLYNNHFSHFACISTQKTPKRHPSRKEFTQNVNVKRNAFSVWSTKCST